MRTLVVFQAGYLRNDWAIELADRADHRICLYRFCGAVSTSIVYRPQLCFVVKAHGLHFRLKLDAVTNAVLIGALFEVGIEFVTLGEIAGPVGVSPEGIGVEVIRRVHAAIRVSVLIPSATHRVVLFKNREVDACRLELHACA